MSNNSNEKKSRKIILNGIESGKWSVTAIVGEKEIILNGIESYMFSGFHIGLYIFR